MHISPKILGTRFFNYSVQYVGYLLLGMHLPLKYAQTLQAQVQVVYITGRLL